MGLKTYLLVLTFFLSFCCQAQQKDGEKSWGLVSISVESLRTEARHASELSTQAILGTPLKILGQSGEFYQVQTPDEYIAYIPDKSVTLLNDTEFEQWKTDRRIIVTVPGTLVMPGPKNTPDRPVCDVVAGCILQYRKATRKWYQVVLPDGREGYLRKNEAAPFEQWANRPFDMSYVEQTAFQMMGSPYLWGGMSTKASDCSGFVRVAYFAGGLLLPRDASQQARCGSPVSLKDWQKEARKGDLLFIGTRPDRISHVGIYLDNGMYIHCSGRVKINSLNPDSEDFIQRYHYISLCRIADAIGTEGIIPVKNHPWFF